MSNEPTPAQLENIEQLYLNLEILLEQKSIEPFITMPSRYGEELLEDAKIHLSIERHQDFIETLFTDFHSHLASQILAADNLQNSSCPIIR